jgi:molybdopterin-containing oxidoreductase family iron-sulfur binding subunit
MFWWKSEKVEEETIMEKRYGMIIDLKRCIGCHTCSIACKAEHNIPKGSYLKVHTVGGGAMDTPKGTYPDLKMHYLPKGCRHCDDAPCMDACPSEALYKREDGIVLVDENKCDGCRLCEETCPYDVIEYNDEMGLIEKCDFCHERVDDGLEPFCVLCCETKAMFFGDLNDPESTVSKLVRDKGAAPLLSEKGTNPSVLYFPEMQ